RLILPSRTGYPIAGAYHTYVADKSKNWQHTYFALCGLSLCYFNYGSDTYHSLLAIFTTHIMVSALRGAPTLMLTLNFLFHMSYLLLGYYYTASNEYDILWTMPHCILTLRMIGYGFDISDGLKNEAELSKDQKATALTQQPSLLELLAYSYFPSSFLVGPQFPYRRYKSFTDGEFRQYEGYFEAGVKRLGVGLVYMAVCQLGLKFLPDEYFLSPEFAAESFIKRIYYLGFWAKFSLYKYISCWLLTEGALMCIGFTYKGSDAEGKPDWSGCSNVKLKLLESGNTMQHYVQSFNVNTNQWVAHYIFKRLKFLNNRTISYGAALAFLAVWHGFHSGYYMAFVMEYMIVSVEKQAIYTKHVLSKYGDRLNNSKVYAVVYFFCLKSYNIVYMGWCLTSFVFLKYERWIVVYRAVNYFGFIYMFVWSVGYNGYRFYRGKEPRQRTSATNAQPQKREPLQKREPPQQQEPE
ncbi:hypothetical protein KR222_008826, partial [Zaprionus bogoriensis]